jgi:hypothetical protein
MSCLLKNMQGFSSRCVVVWYLDKGAPARAVYELAAMISRGVVHTQHVPSLIGRFSGSTPWVAAQAYGLGFLGLFYVHW